MKHIFTSRRQVGFTILELIVAMTMLSIVTLVVSVTIGQIYLNQKQVTLRQNFHDEARLMMERVVQLVRNNTIDYDRYFEVVGPDPALCTDFADEQVDDAIATGIVANTLANRSSLAYDSIFYWDTKGDGIQDRHLGGAVLDGTDDPCTQSFYNSGVNARLYLINADRNIRTAIELDNKEASGGAVGDTSDDELMMQVEYGADTDGDGVVDVWSDDVRWSPIQSPGQRCVFSTGAIRSVLGQPLTDEEGRVFCVGAFEPTNILPGFLELESMVFFPAPNADPFLAFRKLTAQAHPHVYIDFRVVMKDHEGYGFSPNNQPNTRLRTTASSRVFGDSRR